MEDEERMRILLADDQPKVRLGLRLLLEQEQDMEVVAEAAEAGNLLVQVEESQPDLVLLDWSLHDSAAAEKLTALRRACPRIVVIVLSAQPGAEEAALAAGADAFVSKADPPEHLLVTISSAIRVKAATLGKSGGSEEDRNEGVRDCRSQAGER
jgi:DNA-binding NarL/FixJ family response regulator